MQSYSIADAKNNLPGLVHEAECGQAVEITRRGRPVAVLLSMDEYARMQQPRPTFWQALTAFQSSSSPLNDADINALLTPRDTAPGRPSPWDEPFSE